MKQVYVHLGAHKTASTLIQLTLLKHENLRFDSGARPALISAHNPGHDFKAFRLPYIHMRNEMMWRKSEGTKIPFQLIEKMSDHITRYINEIPEDHIVLSDENLLGNTLGHPTGRIRKVQGGLYPVSEEISEAFRRVASEQSFKFRLYTRDVKSLIVSSYNDWIAKLRSSISLEDFTASLDSSALNWEGVIAPWRARFGDTFEVRDFHMIQEDQAVFLRDFAEWCHLDIAPDTRISSRTRMNGSLSARQIKIALSLIPHLNEDERDAARKFLRQLNP